MLVFTLLLHLSFNSFIDESGLTICYWLCPSPYCSSFLPTSNIIIASSLVQMVDDISASHMMGAHARGFCQRGSGLGGRMPTVLWWKESKLGGRGMEWIQGDRILRLLVDWRVGGKAHSSSVDAFIGNGRMKYGFLLIFSTFCTKTFLPVMIG